MSNFFSLLPLALDAGPPQETDRAVVPETRPRAPDSLPIPPAWLEPQPEPAKTPRPARAIFAVLIALFFAVQAWDAITSPVTHVATTQDGACPAPK